MTSSSVRPILAVIVVCLLFTQTCAMPWYVKFWFEPAILIIRYRAAALFNDTGLGLGGFFSKASQRIRDLLVAYGERLQRLLDAIAKLFIDNELLSDDQLESYRQLMYFKQQYIQQGDFTYAYNPINRTMVQG